MTETAGNTGLKDPRFEAFCSPEGPEVFHSIVHRDDIWRADPFDVGIIHDDARFQFERLLNRGTTPPSATAGRILLLLGESGSGKTHLMRAFRNMVHSRQMGYFGYMQMSTLTNNYGRYVLRNLIESLDRPYYEPLGTTTGVQRLSNALAEQPILKRLPIRMGKKRADALTALREWGLEADRLHMLVGHVAAKLVAEPLFRNVDVDLIAALLYLQTGDPYLKNLVMKYLRGEDLAPQQRSRLGDIVPKAEEHDPPVLVEQLGRLMWATQQNCLVVCADQLEDIYNLDNARIQFRRAMDSLREIPDRVPTSIVVISCLEDYYQELKGELPKSVIDRIEQDPDFIRLKTSRTEEEARLLVEYRLRYFYETVDVDFHPDEPTYPISTPAIQTLVGLRTRDILDWCRQVQEKAIKTGEIEPGPVSYPSPGPPLALSQAWNDSLATWTQSPSVEPEDLARILAETIGSCGQEMDPKLSLRVEAQGKCIRVDGWSDSLLIGICNATPRGGRLAREIEGIKAEAQDRRLVMVRSTEFSNNPRTQIAQLIGDLIAQGARRVTIEDSEWRVMLAFPEFRTRHSSEPGFQEWLLTEKPLSSLPGLQKIFGSWESGRQPAVVPPPRTMASGGEESWPEPPRVAPPQAGEAVPVPTAADRLVVGVVSGSQNEAVSLSVDELTRHAAFLGGTGSGKTTVALNIIERLLLRGIPAILVDRKGDLCRYADDQAWLTPLDDAGDASRRERLKETLDVDLYTPGNPYGRALSIALVPEGVLDLADDDKRRLSRCVAGSLCGMMNYKDFGKDLSAQAVLIQAIYLLMAEAVPGMLTLDGVIDVIAAESPALINAIGHLDSRLFKKLVNDLETLRLTKGDLVRSGDGGVNLDDLLGGREVRSCGKTRLSIISTKFLAETRDVEFWVAQFLLAVGRWISKNPSDRLQAVLLFDEADMYLPATRKPPTKEPMEHLLRRARSAGLGIFLATQSPGDFDYKARDNIRTWFVGRIKEQASINKMKPMLSELGGDILPNLSGQAPGEFHLARDGKVERIKTFRGFIAPEQLPEDRILKLAKANKGDVNKKAALR